MNLSKMESKIIGEKGMKPNLNRDSLDFEEIYNLYKGQIFNFILGYIRSRELAEDLTQEVFIKLWENLEITQ